MTLLKKCSLACMLLLAGAASLLAGGERRYSTARQYYSSWHKHPSHGYYYRHYYYKPSPEYSGYKHHYAIYYPSRPNHYYFYNSYTKRYWGRCPVQTNGKEQYSLLAEADRKGKLSEIAETAFPAPGRMPTIPESKDGAIMDLPPDDLPQAELPPK
jgi:hypothetical protein